MCYTYDEQSRVVKRTVISLSGTTETEETFSYDGAGNVTADNSRTFVYDTNNRLMQYNGNPVTYDEDGNMLSATLNGEETAFCFDSGNRLVSAGGHAYTYNAENVRIRNLCADADTTYVYNTNCKLSQLLYKTTNGIATKYVYGLGLIGEEKENCFKTYHFDFRGSTVAITDANGTITDTFTYDTYGKLISRTGNSFVIFGYNGRDGVVTDKNGLLYMRARYYSPELRRFVNADIMAGEISNAITLNRFAYANGNPVSFIDPFGLSAERGNTVNHQYDALVTKALNKTQNTLSSYYRNHSDFDGREAVFNDAITKILNSIETGCALEEFESGVKVRIEINPNYNTSGTELVYEIAGFIPVLGEVAAIVDFASDESLDFKKLFSALGTAITEKDIAKLTPYAKELGVLGEVSNILGGLSVFETLVSWDSQEKIATEVSVFLQYNDGASYMYQAVVDKELSFKECFSDYTGSVLKPNDAMYEFIVE